MKVKRKSKANRWIIGLIVFAVLVGFGAVYATDICHTHTGNGQDGEQFYPAENEDLYLDVKAPTVGGLTAYVTVQGGGLAVRVDALNGQRRGAIVQSEDLGATCIFTSHLGGYGSGTGYANLRTYTGKTSTSSNCIPAGNNQ